MPTLGATLFALACAAQSQRWRLAVVAAFGAAWIVGAFYYQLHWSLAFKGGVLFAAGSVLAVPAWWSSRERKASAPVHGESVPARTRPAVDRRAAIFATLAAALVLVFANYSIWQKEDLIARGDKVFVKLAPLDPRSLMQGDFMRLNFEMPALSEGAPDLLAARQLYAVGRRDERGVVTVQRLAHEGEPPAPGETRIALTVKGGRWIIVTDAWFFKEGEAERFRRARYGEFRVTPDGRALLVGLADEGLRPM
jgi:uncharacterized membrane-anchored protein